MMGTTHSCVMILLSTAHLQQVTWMSEEASTLEPEEEQLLWELHLRIPNFRQHLCINNPPSLNKQCSRLIKVRDK